MPQVMRVACGVVFKRETAANDVDAAVSLKRCVCI